MKTLALSLLALVVLIAANCSYKPVPTPPGPTADAAPPPAPVPTVVADAAPPAPVPPSSADAGPAPAPVPMTPVGQACFNLAALGCPEGKDPSCVAVTQHAIDSGLTKVPLDCLTRAKTAAAARVCGFVACK